MDSGGWPDTTTTAFTAPIVVVGVVFLDVATNAPNRDIPPARQVQGVPRAGRRPGPAPSPRRPPPTPPTPPRPRPYRVQHRSP